MWSDAQLAQLKTHRGFRQRGGEITRLEALTDGAVALAMTFLVIGGNQVPASFAGLIEAFKQVPAFAASFAVLLLFWSSHVRWSRRYGMEDGVAVALSALLIFTLLVFVHPLRIVFGALFAYLSGGWLPSPMRFENLGQLDQVFFAYGLGFCVLELSLWGLYSLALRRRDELRLDALEAFDTELDRRSHLHSLGVGLIATLLALALPPEWVPFSGYSYFLITIDRVLTRRRARASRSRLLAARA